MAGADDRTEPIERFLVRPGDLPGEGWETIEVGGGEGGAPALVGPGLDIELAAAADSPIYRRDGAIVYSAAFVPADLAARRDLFAALGSVELAESFATSLGVATSGPDGHVVGHVVSHPAPDVVRLTFSGTDGLGLVPVHLDLLSLALGPAVTAVWLGDTPAPFPDDDRLELRAALLTRAPGPP